MKYSILVLGASISISLFIRLCCSLEANLEDQMEDLLSGRADEVYEKFLKFSLQSGTTKDKSYRDHENHFIDDWIQDMKTFKNDAPLHTHPAASVGQVSVSSRQGIGTNVDNEELYGNSKPPEIRTTDCDESDDGCACDSNDDQPPPSGCEYNDEIQYMGCNDQQITIIPPLPPTLLTLDLNESQIEKISGSDIRNVTISRIRLYRNKINYINPWAFHDVQNLDTLIIAGNQITYLAYELYVGLDNTTFVDLQHNRISFEIYRQCKPLPEDEIKKVLPQLRWLQFTGNPLTVIPPQMFAGLRESPVIALYLDSCYLQEIDEDAFSYFSQLAILNLSHNPSSLVNPIEKFAKILQPLTSLTNIYLADLGLSEFPLEALLQLSHQLKVLDLSNNKFHTIKYDALSQFSSLEELYLDESSIQVIESNAFENNSKLKSISLRKNVIQQFPTYFPPSLRNLFITNIKLLSSSKTPILNFHNLTSLSILELSAIKFDRISKDTFKGLTELKNIYMRECDVHSIEDGAFQELPNLNALFLDNNVISGISSEAFIGLNNLRTLSLRNCTLSFSPVPSSSSSGSNSTEISRSELSPFKFLPKLKTLDLSENNIVAASPHLFENLPFICYVSFASNPITSWDTRLFPTITTSACYNNFTEVPEDECITPKLDLSNGKVQFMKSAMLEDFRYAREIDLSNNDLVCDEGACKLRDAIFNAPSEDCKIPRTWTSSASYKCKDVQTGEMVYLSQVTDEICSKKYSESEMPTSQSSPSSSGTATTIIVIMASVSLVVSVIIILAYKNRSHLRYFWFTFKFNVMPVTPRKSKISTMEDNSSLSYDYDVFISYHHDDSKFIEEVFLPEIEMQDDSSQTDEPGVVEAKNLVYFIENDKIINKNNNNNAQQNTPRFKVCLHERDFAAGVPITENIVDCVDRSRKTVIFVSIKYMESQWCSYELNLAYHRLVESRRRSFLLVLMEEIPSEFRTKVLTYLMVSKTHLQWPGAEGLEEEKATFWKRLRHFLQSS